MYGKHFASTYTGSMIGAGADVFAVWGYVIANACNGHVELNPRHLSMVLGMPEDNVRVAIDYLCRPDADSRNKNHEGRRLIKSGQFSYEVPSHLHYRSIRDEDGRREYMRNYMKKRRMQESEDDVNVNVNSVSPCKPMLAHTEAEAEAETELFSMDSRNEENISKNNIAQIAFFRSKIYDAYPRKAGRLKALNAIESAIKLLVKERFKGDSVAAAKWLLERVEKYRDNPQTKATEQKFIPHPATWFNAGRYDDPDPDPKDQPKTKTVVHPVTGKVYTVSA